MCYLLWAYLMRSKCFRPSETDPKLPEMDVFITPFDLSPSVISLEARLSLLSQHLPRRPRRRAIPLQRHRAEIRTESP